MTALPANDPGLDLAQPPEGAAPGWGVNLGAAAAAEMAALDEAREITLKFLRRLDRVAESLTVEEAKEAFTRSGHLVVGRTRTDMALRQIVVLEQEIMGLREPTARRGGSGGWSNGGRGGSGGGERLNDLNDLNDLADPEEVSDIHDLAELEDLGEIEDPEFFSDLNALEKYKTFGEFYNFRKRDFEAEQEMEAELDADIAAEVERVAAMDLLEQTDEEHREAIRDMEAQQRAMFDQAWGEMEEEWAGFGLPC